MENKRIQAVACSEPGEGEFIICILDPSIDGEKYVKRLNDDMVLYNEDVEVFLKQLKEINFKHKGDLSFKEITGAECLNEREPKYPKEVPKGCKDLALAYPEITEERKRRREFNKELKLKYDKFINEAKEKVENEIKPFREALLLKWPRFKNYINSSSYDMNIWYKFYLTDFKYVSDETK